MINYMVSSSKTHACKKCTLVKPIDNFRVKKNGDLTLSCIDCLDMNNIKRASKRKLTHLGLLVYIY